MSALIVSYEEKYLPQMREIFFESSTKKEFLSEEDRNNFFYKYLGAYLVNFPEYAFVAVGDRVLGYVVASPQTQNELFYGLQPHLKEFEKYFQKYPAHLHINCHRESRGRGVGKALMEREIETLGLHHIKGLHIMTGLDSANKSFYEKLDFSFTANASSILFMGKSL